MKLAAINNAFAFKPRKNCVARCLRLFVEPIAGAMKTMLYCFLLVVFCFGSASSYANNPPQGQLVVSFSYNTEGLRIEKRGDRGVERYTYDDQSVLSQRDGNNALVARYTYGPNRLISLKHKTEGTQFYLTDALNSIVDLMTTDGLVQARYQYDAFGNKRSESGSSWNRFAFTGYEEDKETNLLYAKARYYDADTGRFLSQDAWQGDNNTPPSLHKYLYAYQNPTVYIDPTGNFPVTDWLKQSADQSTAIQGDMMNSLGGKLGDSFVKDLGVRSMAMGLAAVTKATEAVGSVAGVADASIDASIGSVYGGDVLGQNSRERTVDRIEGAANGVNAAYQFSQRDDAMRVTGQAISDGASNYAEKVRSGDLKTTSNLGVGLGGFAMGGYLASGAKAMTIAGESADAIGSARPLNSKVIQQVKNSVFETKPKRLMSPTTSGVALEASEGKTTTVLGSWKQDMQKIVNELGDIKSTDFGPRTGGFNVLNVDTNLTGKKFFEAYNRPWLANAIDRGDNFLMATRPGFDVFDKGAQSVLSRRNELTKKMELTGFGREYLMLKKAGYSYQDGRMLK